MNREPSKKVLLPPGAEREPSNLTRTSGEPSMMIQGRAAAPQGAVFELDYLIFSLGGDPYALPIGLISEILKLLPITEVPRAPKGIAGVASVRGRLVTVLDLRRRFGLQEPERDRRARILLVDGGDETLGLVVDEVRGVQRFEEGQIEPPQVLGGEPPPHVAGVARAGDFFCMLLDLRPLLEVR